MNIAADRSSTSAQVTSTLTTRSRSRTLMATWSLLAGHIVALVFGLAGLLIALPNPQLWADSDLGPKTFDFGMQYGGSTHILFGAAAVFTLGVMAVGLWRTGVFFVCAVGLSLASELIGTGTGWPFGNYEYTSFLGYKVLDRVPFTIPLSWFYMGLSSYLLGRTVVSRAGGRFGALGHGVASIGLGVWFLVVWDMVLDPAMAHEDLAVQFWVWHQTGPYFGMPVQNYIGWAATGAIFMALSRVLWRREPDQKRYPAIIPALVYVANIVFASALSLSVGLWEPIALTVVLMAAPVAYFFLIRRGSPSSASRSRLAPSR
ncbi:MAG: carotenoid biosynthesis protein [Thermomicrobiales bacterium]